MTLLGFDTIIVNNKFTHVSDFKDLFDFFTPLGIKNFAFLNEFDFVSDNLTFRLNESNELKKLLTDISPRGARIKTSRSISFADGMSQNSNISKLCISRKNHASFISLPIFPDTSNNGFAIELNRLIYRKNIFPVFNSFDLIIKTAPTTFCDKLLALKNVGFALDINFLLDTNNSKYLEIILDNNTHVLPSVSHDVSSYIGIVKQSESFCDILGKKNYYKLCSQINKTSSLIGF